MSSSVGLVSHADKEFQPLTGEPVSLGIMNPSPPTKIFFGLEYILLRLWSVHAYPHFRVRGFLMECVWNLFCSRYRSKGLVGCLSPAPKETWGCRTCSGYFEGSNSISYRTSRREGTNINICGLKTRAPGISPQSSFWLHVSLAFLAQGQVHKRAKTNWTHVLNLPRLEGLFMHFHAFVISGALRLVM